MKPSRYKPKQVEIAESDPFKDDLLDRRNSAEVLTEFVGTLSEPFVLTIDSPWGTGKTTFLRMWKRHLENQRFHCLYFNAWENDFSDSPLVSLIGEIGAGIEMLALEDGQKRNVQQIFEQTKKAGATLLKAVLPTAVKLATSGLLNLSPDTETEIGSLAENLARKQIEKYQADKETITNFRDKLRELVTTLANKDTGSIATPLVFIVDELDRCRPTYAVELLEKIKHLFSVEGIVFVLAIDRRQLGKSVEALYGVGMDSDGYLRRFVDLEFLLPEVELDRFCKAQFGRFGLDSLIDLKKGNAGSDASILPSLIAKLFAVFRFSLRTQEQCFTQLAIVLRTTPVDCYLYSYLLALLVCLRIANRDLYVSYCMGRISHHEVLHFLRSLPGGSLLLATTQGDYMHAHLIGGIRDQKLREAAERDYTEKAKGQSHDALRHATVLRYLPDVGEGVVDMTGYLHKKIEMAHRFVKPE